MQLRYKLSVMIKVRRVIVAVLMFVAGLSLIYWSWQPIGREAGLNLGIVLLLASIPMAAVGDQTVAAMMARKTIDEFERAAEAAYAAMYEAKPYSVKDCYDDAQLYFSHAIAAAKRACACASTGRCRPSTSPSV